MPPHKEESKIFQGLENSWFTLKYQIADRFMDLGKDVADVTHLVKKLTKAGFESTCRLSRDSVTCTVTIELEQMKQESLNNKPTNRHYI